MPAAFSGFTAHSETLPDPTRHRPCQTLPVTKPVYNLPGLRQNLSEPTWLYTLPDPTRSDPFRSYQTPPDKPTDKSTCYVKRPAPIHQGNFRVKLREQKAEGESGVTAETETVPTGPYQT